MKLKMDENPEENPKIKHDRFQNILRNLSKCKIDLVNEKDEINRLREVNSRLEIELKEARELEKSHRYHLLTSREMIGNLQETVSQLVYLKRDVKKLKDELAFKDSTVAALEKEKESITQKYDASLKEFQSAQEKQIEELTILHQRKIQQVEHDSDTNLAQFTCVIEELRTKIKEMESEHRDKMNIVVLDYEEKLQRGAAEVAQLQEQLARQATRTDSNIDAYRRRLEELEEALKQSQFKQYLAQSSYSTQFETQVERPYSVDRDLTEASTYHMDPELETPRQRVPIETRQNFSNQKTSKPPSNSLQVTYYGNKQANTQKNEKKGPFNISKKRKLYSDKEFPEF